MIVFDRLSPPLPASPAMLPCVVFAQIQLLPLQSPSSSNFKQANQLRAPREWGLKNISIYIINLSSYPAQTKHFCHVKFNVPRNEDQRNHSKGSRFQAKQPVSTTCFAPCYKTTQPATPLTCVKLAEIKKTMRPLCKHCNHLQSVTTCPSLQHCFWSKPNIVFVLPKKSQIVNGISWWIVMRVFRWIVWTCNWFQNNVSKSSYWRLPTTPTGMRFRTKRLVLLVLSLLFLCFLAKHLSTKTGHSLKCCSINLLKTPAWMWHHLQSPYAFHAHHTWHTSNMCSFAR